LGTTSSQPITRPAGLHDDLPGKFQQVIDWASSEGQLYEFASEFRASLERAKVDNDLRPLSNIIEAWWRSLLFRRNPNYEAAVHEAIDEQPGKPMRLKNLLADLGR
jgi:hypothetical protein